VKLTQKQEITKDLRERFKKSKVVIVTDYKGLDVTSLNTLRRQLREAGCEYQVVKNTLLVRAAEETDVALIKDNFKGPNAVALSYEDPVAPAKVLTGFAKDHEKLEIKVGVLNGKFLDAGAIKALAALPSREVLLSQVLAAMNGVPGAFVRVLSGIPQKMLNVLVAIKEQKAEV
jgi:large subunit ribosomal protein L10